MVWGAILVPFVSAGLILLFKGRWVKWYEIVVPFVVSLLMIFISERATEYAQVSDTEYWTGYIEEAEYYEHWNEKVSCRHPKYKTVTKTRPKTKTVTKTVGVGKNARTETTTVPDGVETYTEQVQDGWEHAFDVDEHSAYWRCEDNTGKSYSISSGEFERLAHKFGNRQWVNLHRDFYTINGNKYVAKFGGQDERMEVCTHTHTYENRLQASHSILRHRDVDKAEKELYGLVDYPEIKDYTQPMIIGFDDPAGQRKLEVLNARYGKSKQVRVWIVVFKNQPLDAGYAQEAYWGGGNKNELVLLIGINDKNHVEWGHVASWTEREDVKVKCRNAIYEQEQLNISKLVDDIRPMIEKDWERRHFKEFKGLTVDPPFWAVMTTYIVTIVVNLAMVALFSLYNKD